VSMKVLMVVGLCLLAPVLIFFVWATYPWELSPRWESGLIGVERTGVSDSIERPTTLTLMSWNMAYAYGMGSEGTPDYTPRDKSFYEQNLGRISDAVKLAGADVVFLQEIDFASSRSHHIDQLKVLAQKTGLKHWARAESWRTQYVPFPYWPFNRQFGGMLSGGAMLSRWPIVKNEVHLLTKPTAKAWWYNLFYLYRYFQVVTIKVHGREMKLVNLHLEAFDHATKDAQARDLVDYAKKTKLDFIAGDFNMLPEGAMKRSGFANPADVYWEDKSYTILKALPLTEIVEHGAYLQKEENWFTFPSVRPDRRLDYIYHAPGWSFMSAEVVSGAHASASDHLPIKATFKLFDPEFIRD
jgi:endonuclease/exonuclease/phosphatase family metal-dependent hydrolase